MADDKPDETALARQLEPPPDYFPAGDRRGADDLTAEDVLVPRLALAQALSPEVTQGDPKFIEGLKPGDLFNSMSGVVYGRKVYVQILRRDRLRAMQFRPMEQGGGIIRRNVPMDDPMLEWGPNGEKPLATVFRDYLARLLPSGEQLALSFKISGIKAAKALNGKIAWRQRPIFSGRYEITTEIDLKPKPHWVYLVENAGWVGRDDATIGNQLFELYKDLDLTEKIHRDISTTEDDFDPKKLEGELSATTTITTTAQPFVKPEADM